MELKELALRLKSLEDEVRTIRQDVEAEVRAEVAEEILAE